jgi:gustatory receptor
MLFGLFPISGLFTRDPQKLKFSWLSLRTVFSGCFIAASASYALLNLYFQVNEGPLTPSNVVGVIFFGNCCIISIFFFKFAMNFGEIMQRWSQVERNLQKTNFREAVISSKWSLKKRVNVCLTVSLCFAAVEHALAVTTSYNRSAYERSVCNWTIGNELQDFITKQLFFTFNVISYNHFNAVIAEYFNVSFTFYWSFLDIFLMITSLGLSYNYEKINNRLKFFRERVVHDEVWHEIRKEYNEVSELVRFIDKHLDKMIILACLNDAYFILVQLLNLTM